MQMVRYICVYFFNLLAVTGVYSAGCVDINNDSKLHTGWDKTGRPKLLIILVWKKVFGAVSRILNSIRKQFSFFSSSNF